MESPGLIHVFGFALVESAMSFYFLPQYFPVYTLSAKFLFFVLVNFSIFTFYHLIIYPFFRSPLRHLPKPPMGFIPIIGHGGMMFERPPGSAHVRLMKETPNDGIIYFRSFLHQDRLLLTSPAAHAEVLVHNSYDFEKPPWVRRFLRQFLGDGLLLIEGDEHRHQRKQIMPAFNFRHIKELYPIFWSKSIELCEVVKAELWDRTDKVLEMNHFATKVTLDIIGLAGLGRDIASLRSSDDELIKNYEEILEPTPEKGLYFVLHLLMPVWLIKALPWKLNERTRITTGELKRICGEFLMEKKSRMKMENEEHLDILGLMIRSNNFSDEGLVHQLLTFLAAGHETTSSALTWATHLLAMNIDIQTLLRAEIHKNIPNPKALSDTGFDIPAVLESLPYLNAVCNETLRLYPTIPSSGRLAIRDTTILNTFVPKGTVVYITPWAINRAPHLWGPDAEEFKPERWIDSNTGKSNYMGGAESNYSFLTFLHGPRSCIGEKFARAELRALVAVFVGNFEWEMADKNEVVQAGGTITCKPINGMKLRLRPAEW
ncbi:cytochrome P450 [Lojkania enalia]|uniref:Cytochrome P450 n=1 Tax=Lojkania enalia TaxID=147567 RepID=A0A9P4JXA3_9PLEO|nr:cytochrome P450 [Didymosphaeria enalia]